MACREYYLAQQSLRRSEEEQVFLESQLLNADQETEALKASILSVQDDLEKEIRRTQEGRYGEDPCDVEAEKVLHTRLSLNTGALTELKNRLSIVEQQLKREASSLKTLERSLQAQSNANTEFVSASRSLISALDAAAARKAQLVSQRDALMNQIQATSKKMQTMNKSVQCRVTCRSRSQVAMRDWDLDTLRMKHEIAISRGVYSEERNYQEEQTAFLQQLLEENRRLKLIAKAKLTQPTHSQEMGLNAQGIEPDRPPLEKLRESNIRLLQQLTSSLSVLQAHAI